MRKREIWLIGIFAILFAGLGLYFGMKKWELSPPETDAGTHFFAQSLPDMNGNVDNLSKWKGKLLLVNFWATWCAPCVEEMPELSELQTEGKLKNLQIIGIGIDSPANIRDFSIRHNIAYPLYPAGMGGSELSKQLGNQVGGLPFTILISPDGKIQKTYIGRLNMTTVRRDLGLFS